MADGHIVRFLPACKLKGLAGDQHAFLDRTHWKNPFKVKGHGDNWHVRPEHNGGMMRAIFRKHATLSRYPREYAARTDATNAYREWILFCLRTMPEIYRLEDLRGKVLVVQQLPTCDGEPSPSYANVLKDMLDATAGRIDEGDSAK